MKKILMIALCLVLVPMLFAGKSKAPIAPDHNFTAPNVGSSQYTGSRSTPTLVDVIDLSPIPIYVFGLTYDWERDGLWVSQFNTAYPWVYCIQKTSPFTKIDSFQLVGAPGYFLGTGYAGGDVMYAMGYDGYVYEVDMTTGVVSSYRSIPPWPNYGISCGFNAVDDVIYGADWGFDQCSYAQPAQTGTWNTWSLSSACGASGAYGTSSPAYLFYCNEDASQAQFFQHSVTAGIPNTTPDSVWDCDPSQSQASTADCAFDGQYVYVLDQGDPDKIFVYDVGITGGPAAFWDFETGWQGWTNTNGQAFPAGWGVMESDYKATWQLPESGDSSMWIDSDAAGSGTWVQDTALSPILVPRPAMDWLKYGVSYNNISTGEWLEVGIKYYDGATWNVVPLVIYTADTGPMWDSVDVSAYVSYPFVQVYFYFDDDDIWAWYAAFDNVSIDASEAIHDVGTDAILEPVGTYFLNDVVTPRAQVRNFGAFDETFPVIFTMTHNATLVYADTVAMTLASGVVDTAVFASHTFDQTGTYDIVGYTELAGDEDPANDTATAQANVYAGLIPYIVIDVDPTPLTGPWLDAMFQSWGLTGVYTTNPAAINADSLAIYQTAWICTGIYSNYYSYTDAEAIAIGDYLATGRRAYFEGGDAWGFVTARTILCPLFGIDPNTTTDGDADLFQVDGMANGQIPEVDGHNWTYTGENNWIDRLGLYASPPNGGTVEGFLWNSSVSYWTGAAYDQGTWKTVGLSHELAGDVAGTIPGDSLLWWIAEYFGLPVGITEEPEAGANIAVFGFAPNMSTVTKQPIINYSTTTQGRECLKVYDNTGRLIRTLVDRPNEAAGTKSVYWNRKDDTGRTVANGVYFIRLESVNQYATHKLILVK